MSKTVDFKSLQKESWKTKIPRLEDKTFDCDIFVLDGAEIASIRLTGNLVVGDHCTILHIVAGADVWVGYATHLGTVSCANLFVNNGSYLHGDIHADGHVIIGNFVEGYYACSIFAAGDITIGDTSHLGIVSAIGNIIVGNDVIIYHINAFACLMIGKNSDIGSLYIDSLISEENNNFWLTQT